MQEIKVSLLPCLDFNAVSFTALAQFTDSLSKPAGFDGVNGEMIDSKETIT